MLAVIIDKYVSLYPFIHEISYVPRTETRWSVSHMAKHMALPPALMDIGGTRSSYANSKAGKKRRFSLLKTFFH